MSRFVFSFLMAPLCGTQVLWLMNNQEPFMVVCVLQQAACAVQGRRSRSGCWLGRWLLLAYLPFNRDNLGNTDMGPIAHCMLNTTH